MHVLPSIGEILRTNWVWLLIGASFWLASYYIYLSLHVRRYLEKRAPTRWGVDLASRRVTSGRKPIN